MIAKICKDNTLTLIYEVSVLAKEFGCAVLFLPVAQPELNPIEMVWAFVKGYAAKKNVDFSLAKVEKYIDEAFETFDESNWVKYVDHCIKIEDQYLEVADDISLDLEN